MFSADITWTPLAEEPGLRRPVSSKDRENASLKSREAVSIKSGRSHIPSLRWPLSKKSKQRASAVEDRVQSQRSSVTSTAAQHGLIPYDRERDKSPNSEIIKRLGLQEKQVRDSQTSSETASAHNEVFELPAPAQSESCSPLHPPPSYVSRASQVSSPAFWTTS